MNGLTLSRLDEFRKLKKVIRGSDEHLIVGIDVAKEKHNAFFGTATGSSLLRRLIFDNSREGFEILTGRARALQIQAGLGQVVFGMEPTADYHKPLAEYLITNGFNVVLVSAQAAKENRKTLDGRWDKNDTKDSANVTDLISQGKFQYYDLPSPPIGELRNLLSLKRKLKKYEHSIRLRIKNHLVSQFFPELDRYLGSQEVENTAIVKWCLDPRKIAALEFEKFLRIVTTRNRGIGQRQRLQAIQEAARCSIGCAAGESVMFEARLLVDNLQTTRDSLVATNARIGEVCHRLPGYAAVISIPGVGPAIAATLLATIGDPHRFNNAREVIKLAGLDLSANRSGKYSDEATPRLSKKGNASLRYALYQAAVIATSKNGYFVEYLTKIVQGRSRERGIKSKMRVKVAAKILVIAWTLLKKGGKFQGEHLLG